MTGFSLTLDGSAAFATSTQVDGRAYGASYAQSAAMLTTAVSDMEAAYTDAANAVNTATTNLGGSIGIGGMNLNAGVYTWTVNLLIDSDLTLTGGPFDTFILRTTGYMTLGADVRVLLTGGLTAANVVWQVAGYVSLGARAHLEGIVLGKTKIEFITGSSLNGRVLAQTAAVLQMATIAPPLVFTAAEGCDDLTVAIDDSLTTARSRAVTVDSEVACADPEQSPRPVVYAWSLRDEDGESIFSTSRDPAAFTLDPYTLHVGRFDLTLSVTDPRTGQTATASTTIGVERPRVVASILGGDERRVAVNSGVVISAASSSCDEQDDEAVLEFAWRCVDGCDWDSGLVISTEEQIQVDDLNLKAGVYVFEATVARDGQTATKKVTYRIVDEQVPSVFIEPRRRASASQRLVLKATVSGSSDGNLTSTWSIPRRLARAWPIEKWAKTPVTLTTSAGERPHNMVLPAGALVAGSTYTFELTAFDGAQGVSSVTLVAAAPPQAGRLVVNPKSGRELKTRFALSAARWTTDDPPLTYAFYSLLENKKTTLRTPKRAASLRGVYLPAGNVTLSVQAEDALGGTSATARVVEVAASRYGAQARMRWSRSAFDGYMQAGDTEAAINAVVISSASDTDASGRLRQLTTKYKIRDGVNTDASRVEQLAGAVNAVWKPDASREVARETLGSMGDLAAMLDGGLTDVSAASMTQTLSSLLGSSLFVDGTNSSAAELTRVLDAMADALLRKQVTGEFAVTQTSTNLKIAMQKVEQDGLTVKLPSSATSVEVGAGLPEEGGVIVQEFAINPFGDEISSTVVRVGLSPDTREAVISDCERRLTAVPTLSVAVNFQMSSVGANLTCGCGEVANTTCHDGTVLTCAGAETVFCPQVERLECTSWVDGTWGGNCRTEPLEGLTRCVCDLPMGDEPVSFALRGELGSPYAISRYAKKAIPKQSSLLFVFLATLAVLTASLAVFGRFLDRKQEDTQGSTKQLRNDEDKLPRSSSKAKLEGEKEKRDDGLKRLKEDQPLTKPASLWTVSCAALRWCHPLASWAKFSPTVPRTTRALKLGAEVLMVFVAVALETNFLLRDPGCGRKDTAEKCLSPKYSRWIGGGRSCDWDSCSSECSPNDSDGGGNFYVLVAVMMLTLPVLKILDFLYANYLLAPRPGRKQGIEEGGFDDYFAALPGSSRALLLEEQGGSIVSRDSESSLASDAGARGPRSAVKKPPPLDDGFSEEQEGAVDVSTTDNPAPSPARRMSGRVSPLEDEVEPAVLDDGGPAEYSEAGFKVLESSAGAFASDVFSEGPEEAGSGVFPPTAPSSDDEDGEALSTVLQDPPTASEDGVTTLRAEGVGSVSCSSTVQLSQVRRVVLACGEVSADLREIVAELYNEVEVVEMSSVKDGLLEGDLLFFEASRPLNAKLIRECKAAGCIVCALSPYALGDQQRLLAAGCDVVLAGPKKNKKFLLGALRSLLPPAQVHCGAAAEAVQAVDRVVLGCNAELNLELYRAWHELRPDVEVVVLDGDKQYDLDSTAEVLKSSSTRSAFVFESSRPLSKVLAFVRGLREREAASGSQPAVLIALSAVALCDEKRLLKAGVDIVLSGPRNNTTFLTSALGSLFQEAALTLDDATAFFPVPDVVEEAWLSWTTQLEEALAEEQEGEESEEELALSETSDETAVGVVSGKKQKRQKLHAMVPLVRRVVETQLQEIRSVAASCQPKTAKHMRELERQLVEKWGDDRKIAKELKTVLLLAKRLHGDLPDPEGDGYLEAAEGVLIEANRVSLMDSTTRAVYRSTEFEFKIEAPEESPPLLAYLCAWAVWIAFIVGAVSYLAVYCRQWSTLKTWYCLWHVLSSLVLYYVVVALFSVLYFKAYIPHSLKKLNPTSKSFPHSLKTPSVGIFLLEQCPELAQTRTGMKMLPLVRSKEQSRLLAIQELEKDCSEERSRYVQAELEAIGAWRPRLGSRCSLKTIYYFTRLPVMIQWLALGEFILFCVPVVHYCLGAMVPFYGSSNAGELALLSGFTALLVAALWVLAELLKWVLDLGREKPSSKDPEVLANDQFEPLDESPKSHASSPENAAALTALDEDEEEERDSLSTMFERDDSLSMIDVVINDEDVGPPRKPPLRKWS